MAREGLYFSAGRCYMAKLATPGLQAGVQGVVHYMYGFISFGTGLVQYRILCQGFCPPCPRLG